MEVCGSPANRQKPLISSLLSNFVINLLLPSIVLVKGEMKAFEVQYKLRRNETVEDNEVPEHLIGSVDEWRD